MSTPKIAPAGRQRILFWILYERKAAFHKSGIHNDGVLCRQEIFPMVIIRDGDLEFPAVQVLKSFVGMHIDSDQSGL